MKFDQRMILVLCLISVVYWGFLYALLNGQFYASLILKKVINYVILVFYNLFLSIYSVMGWNWLWSLFINVFCVAFLSCILSFMSIDAVPFGKWIFITVMNMNCGVSITDFAFVDVEHPLHLSWCHFPYFCISLDMVMFSFFFVFIALPPPLVLLPSNTLIHFRYVPDIQHFVRLCFAIWYLSSLNINFTCIYLR